MTQTTDNMRDRHVGDVDVPILIHLLVVNAYAFYCSTLRHRGPIEGALAERMEHPVAGDIVLEISKLAAQPEIDRVGELLRADRAEKRFLIRTFDGRTVTWTDAAFIAIVRRDTPDDRTFFPHHVAFR